MEEEEEEGEEEEGGRGERRTPAGEAGIPAGQTLRKEKGKKIGEERKKFENKRGRGKRKEEKSGGRTRIGSARAFAGSGTTPEWKGPE